MNTETKQQRAERLVQQEVFLCVSSVVSTLAGGSGLLERPTHRDLANLMDQAYELAAPVLDYEEAAREAGWENAENHTAFDIDAWKNLCEAYRIEPHEREVFEHWAVSDWLAERLTAKGERVARDFAGWNVWARTTSGQSISIDAVVESIVADLYKAEG